jgi:hypothetical protein
MNNMTDYLGALTEDLQQTFDPTSFRRKWSYMVEMFFGVSVVRMPDHEVYSYALKLKDKLTNLRKAYVPAFEEKRIEKL